MMKPVPAHPRTHLPPTHVGIIMDGNGRWAEARGLPRIAGHRQGAEAVRATVKAAIAHGVAYLTLYGFSQENWKRPKTEVTALMGLLRIYLREEIAALDEQGVRVTFIGQRDMLEPDIVSLIEAAEAVTRKNSRLRLIVALSYGARQEITAAARNIARAAVAGEINPERINEALFESHLETAGIPDPDFVIRTSGEKRVSNFLLWQLAYAELVFVETHWPDFCGRDLEEAIDEFHRRERRYGATG